MTYIRTCTGQPSRPARTRTQPPSGRRAHGAPTGLVVVEATVSTRSPSWSAIPPLQERSRTISTLRGIARVHAPPPVAVFPHQWPSEASKNSDAKHRKCTYRTGLGQCAASDNAPDTPLSGPPYAKETAMYSCRASSSQVPLTSASSASLDSSPIIAQIQSSQSSPCAFSTHASPFSMRMSTVG